MGKGSTNRTILNKLILYAAACITLLSACGPSRVYYPISHIKAASFVTRSNLPEAYLSPCRNPLNYVPDSLHPAFNPLKTVRIAWHCLDNPGGGNNFTQENGRIYLYNLVENANFRLRNIKKMNLPLGNNTDVFDPGFQWKITPSMGFEKEGGYYFHTQENPLYFLNKGPKRSDYNMAVFDELGVGLDSVLNIFVIPFPPDSFRHQQFRMNESGIALGNHVKLGGLFQRNKPEWEVATLLSHEIGHVFGLSHAWHADGCEDTPNHPNCWNYTDSPPCDKNVSNNLMDYNSEMMALTPCQIGRVHMKMADTLAKQRKLVEPYWCRNDTSKVYAITDTIEWLGWRDIDASIVIENGGWLKVCCRLGMPADSYILVKAGGTLVLEEVVIHNDCGHQWKGIEIEKSGKTSGKVIEIGHVVQADVQKEPSEKTKK